MSNMDDVLDEAAKRAVVHKDQVFTVEWSASDREFRVVKVPRQNDAKWCQYEDESDALAVARGWNDDLRRRYSNG